LISISGSAAGVSSIAVLLPDCAKTLPVTSEKEVRKRESIKKKRIILEVCEK